MRSAIPITVFAGLLALGLAGWWGLGREGGAVGPTPAEVSEGQDRPDAQLGEISRPPEAVAAREEVLGERPPALQPQASGPRDDGAATVLVLEPFEPGVELAAGEPFDTFLSEVDAGGRETRSKLLALRSGQLRVPLHVPWRPGGVRELRIQRTGGSRSGAILDLSRDIGPGEVNLGPVQLAPLPLIAAGVVIDATGRPVEGVQIHVSAQVGSEGHWIVLGLDREARSDERGRFALRGWLPEPVDEVRLSGSHRGYRQHDTVTVAHGADDAVIELSATGSVAVERIVDAGIPLANVGVRLAAEPAERPRWRSGTSHDPLVLIDRLDPGRYRVEVTLQGMREPLMALPDVEIRAGEVTRDPRLNPVDLRGRLKTIALRLRNAEGEALTEALVMHREAGSRARWGRQQVMRSSSVQLVTTGFAVDLLVSSPGYREAERRGVTDDQTIVLLAGYPVDLHLIGGLPELPDRVQLQASLALIGRDTFTPSGGGDFQADGSCSIQAPHTGRHRLNLHLVHHLLSGGNSTLGFPAEEPELEILPSEVPQVFEVRLSRAHLDTALAQLGVKR